MKKTYSAPELENIKLSSMQFLAASASQLNAREDGDGTVLSKGFSGGLWDDEDDTEE